MTLSTLIKKGGLAELATATPATQETDPAPTVAAVATVAVAERSEPRIAGTSLLATPGLSGDEESKIRAWLAHIGENDTKIIVEVLDNCRAGLAARAYFLERARELSKQECSDHNDDLP